MENAIKHGIAPSRDGGDLVIGLRRDGSDLVLRVANTGIPLNRGMDGIGLTNLRRRLELIGEAKAGFTLRAEDGWTVAEVRTPAAPSA